MNAPTPILLTSILTHPFDLVYAIPLLLLSVLLTFSGAFLTLDRTSSFAPADTRAKNASRFRIEGGIGGLAAGYVFGIHLSTFTSLVIMNKMTMKPLGAAQFFVSWLLPAVVFAILGARWKLVALLFLALSGSAAMALFLSVISHPSLLARLIFLCIITPVLTVLCLIPKPNIRHPAARVASVFTGSFGAVVAISILGRFSSWGNVWMRFISQVSSDWGTAQEKGISTLMAFLALLGAGTDWILKKKLGENPDEKWDSYLANYASNLPSNGDRAGAFEPLTSFWDRIFNKKSGRPTLFPSDAELHSGARRPPNRLRPRAKGRQTSHPLSQAKIRTRDAFSSGSDSDSDPEQGKQSLPMLKKHKSSLSGSTLLDSEVGGEKDRSGKGRKPTKIEEYSDEDEELPAQKEGEAWKPVFLRRHESRKSNGGFTMPRLSPTNSSADLQPSPTANYPQAAPLGAVPATPSLLHAMNRVAVAQNQAMGGDRALSPPPRPGYGSPSGTPTPQAGAGDQWRGFWADVKDRASS